MSKNPHYLISKSCKHFTLLEIMITIFLIGIVASAVSINLNKALHKHHYENNIKKFDSYVEFSKKMAFSNQADIYMHLTQTETKIGIEIGTSSDMGFFKNIKKTQDSFNNMNFKFNGEKLEKLEIVFTSNGNILTQGKFEFMDVKEKIEKIVERKI